MTKIISAKNKQNANKKSEITRNQLMLRHRVLRDENTDINTKFREDKDLYM